MILASKLKQRHQVADKLREAAVSVLPIICIVGLISFTVIPIGTDLLLAFLVGALLVIAGMAFFTLGSESSLTPIGSKTGAVLTKTRKLPLIIGMSFALGVFVTIAEPDLQVLAETVPHIPNLALIIAVGAGVGGFLVLSMLRIIFGWSLKWVLMACYALVFALTLLAPSEQLAVAFDSGGVTTGPMTVPFILALGVGISNIRADARAESDSFGLVALCSIGPILAVLALSFFFEAGSITSSLSFQSWSTTTQLGLSYVKALPSYMLEMFLSLLPILVVFLLFQFRAFKLPVRSFVRVLIGILFTYVGLVLFMTGVNVGFSPLGAALGKELALSSYKWLLIPLAMLLGWFIISAEPAVYVLENQIEEISAGAIPGKRVKLSLSIAISLAMGIAMLRVLTGISIMWFLLPGYIAALVLAFIVPDIYTAIAFDSGGVASGPMTATFMLQFMIGVCDAVGGNMVSDAFGVVALVAMMPLISVQIMGLVVRISDIRHKHAEDAFGDEDIIEILEEGK